jgi:hypothetical protein
MSINVVVSSTAAGVSVSGGTAVSIEVAGGVGPAGFITAPGTATNAFGVFQLAAGNGITITTSAGQFQIASYSTTQVANLAAVSSVAGRTGAVVLQAADITAGTFSVARLPTISYTALSDVPLSFVPSAHTHDASAIATGTLAVARLPTISYTALSNVPVSFAPSTHTHSTADIQSFTAAAAAAAPVQSVQGRTGTISFTRADLTAAAATHTHAVSDVTNFTNVANVVSVYGVTGAVEITGGGIVSVSRAGNTISINAAASTATAAVVAAIWPALILGG